ncbi:hypothetical protein ACFPJ4_06705 [Lysinimonas soli]|uniref:DNA translocase FtsK 4TM region domain-containing protein n=1 Tax=Lysinimonas soli TaxID=1074233 RepID=A0ABW0NNJ4_9MICO
MPDTITRAITRPGAYPAFLAALGVFVALLALGFVHSLLSALQAVSLSASGNDVGQLWLAQLLSSISGPLPFAIGILLCFWQIAPIAPQLRLAHVVTRSLLAVVVAAVLLWVVDVVVQFVADIASRPFSYDPGAIFGRLGQNVLYSLISAMQSAVSYLPVAVLAGILLWGWLQRHPPTTPVRGALDEV